MCAFYVMDCEDLTYTTLVSRVACSGFCSIGIEYDDLCTMCEGDLMPLMHKDVDTLNAISNQHL